MEFVETRDSLGFVGARVMRHSRRARRRRQRASSAASTSASSSAMKPDPGAAANANAETDDGGNTEPSPALVLYGWITRYDTRLDTYTLFLPDGGGAMICPRSDVLKFVSNPEFQLCTDTDDAFPPPVEDHTSRFVGVPLRKRTSTAKATKKRGRRTSLGEDTAEKSSAKEAQTVDGRVVCYRPFADVYRVAYDDGSTVDMSESDIVDALLVFVKRVQQQKENEREKEKEEEEKEDVEMDETTTTRKRRRSEEHTEADGDDDEETEDEEPPLAMDGVRAEDGSRQEETVPAASGSSLAFVPKQKILDAAMPETSDAVVSSAALKPELDAVDPETDFDFADADDDEPMELLPLDDDDDDDDDHARNSNDSAPVSTTAPAAPILSTSSEVVEILDEDDAVTMTPAPPPSTTPVAPVPAPVVTGPRPVYYVVHAKPHTATKPFEKRSMAFEFLRVELTKLLDAEECAALEVSLVSDIMTNRDIKDRDAVRRFVETGGLVVVNCVLNARARDALVRPETRYERVLFVLKLLAMLPTPSEQQIMESSIGKTIGRMIKSRMHDQHVTPDATMPKRMAHLAKWIKQKWIANMRREKKPPATAASKTTTKKKHLQRPTGGRPSGQRANDFESIPWRSTTALFPSRPPQIPSFAASTGTPSIAPTAPTTDVLGSVLSSPRYNPQKSSLKPDWMRQKETLKRTRFTINTDANAERQHYQRDRRNAAAAAADVARGPTNSRATDDAGARGVYGRPQRLSFGPRWNVCEFFKDTPPSAVRRANGNNSNHSHSYRHRPHEPKPILRKISKYCDDLTF